VSDRIFGGLGLLFSIFYIWQASLVQDSFMTDIVGPRTFPYLLGAGLAIASTVIFFKPDAVAHWPAGRQLFELAMTVAVMGLYAWALPSVGFLIATALAAAYLTWRLGTSPAGSVVFGVGTAIGIYIVFKLILGLSLAQGPLGF
jgi:putative tricarboxylic transport membrane protein